MFLELPFTSTLYCLSRDIITGWKKEVTIDHHPIWVYDFSPPDISPLKYHTKGAKFKNLNTFYWGRYVHCKCSGRDMFVELSRGKNSGSCLFVY